MKESHHGQDRFYLVQDPCSRVRFRGHWESELDPGKVSRAECSVDKPVMIYWAMGKSSPGKLIWTTSFFSIIVRRDFAQALSESGITGWSSYEVIVVNGALEPSSDFVGLAIRGRCGALDYRNSKIELKEYPGGWFPELRGVGISTKDWDGSDLFTSRQTSHVLCTDKVVRILKKWKMSEVIVTPLPEDQTSLSLFEKNLSDDRLPQDLVSRVLDLYRSSGHPLPTRWQERADQSQETRPTNRPIRA